MENLLKKLFSFFLSKPKQEVVFNPELFDAEIAHHYDSCRGIRDLGYRKCSLGSKEIFHAFGVSEEPIFYRESARRFFEKWLKRPVASEELEVYSLEPKKDFYLNVADTFWICGGYVVGIGLKPSYGYIGGIEYSVNKVEGIQPIFLKANYMCRSYEQLILRVDISEGNVRPVSIECIEKIGRVCTKDTWLIYDTEPSEKELLNDCDVAIQKYQRTFRY